MHFLDILIFSLYMLAVVGIGFWFLLKNEGVDNYYVGDRKKIYASPQLLGYFYNSKVAFLAGIISGMGYLGFTSSQILAGVKLVSTTFIELKMQMALVVCCKLPFSRNGG